MNDMKGTVARPISSAANICRQVRFAALYYIAPSETFRFLVPQLLSFFHAGYSKPSISYVTSRVPSKDTIEVTQGTKDMMHLFELENPSSLFGAVKEPCCTSDEVRRFESVESCTPFTSEDWAEQIYFRIR
jgi:hypothetical protein